LTVALSVEFNERVHFESESHGKESRSFERFGRDSKERSIECDVGEEPSMVCFVFVRKPLWGEGDVLQVGDSGNGDSDDGFESIFDFLRVSVGPREGLGGVVFLVLHRRGIIWRGFAFRVVEAADCPKDMVFGLVIEGLVAGGE
jgi:hypothetical protein